MTKKEKLQKKLTDAGIDFAPKDTIKMLEGLLDETPVDPDPIKTKHNGDIVIDMVITTADGEKHSDSVTIKSPRGCISASKVTDPAFITDAIKQGMVERFGRNHIR